MNTYEIKGKTHAGETVKERVYASRPEFASIIFNVLFGASADKVKKCVADETKEKQQQQ